tara:strand:- start:234 stop:392 length:159 start_codon:yes stop_codon:yes gene_type:complete
MQKKQVDKLVKEGGARLSSTDQKNTQQRQVVAHAGKLRVQVGMGKPNGKANS